jgi:hypothetical protein
VWKKSYQKDNFLSASALQDKFVGHVHSKAYALEFFSYEILYNEFASQRFATTYIYG